jgi:hypothetical protein
MQKKQNTLINVELDRFEKKLNELQRYLLDNVINDEMHPDTKYKEIDCQLKVMQSVLNWLPVLEVLRGGEAKKDARLETRGGSELNEMFKTVLENGTTK